MTKKDYELIAKWLRTTANIGNMSRLQIAESCATMLAATNPKFNRDRFLAAADPER